MVCKQKALNVKENDKDRPTYFISLVAADKLAKPARNKHLFDVTSRMKMVGIFKDVHDLLHFYLEQQEEEEREKTKSRLENYYDTYQKYEETPHDSRITKLAEAIPDVYDLLMSFVKGHRNSNIIVDELPFISSQHYSTASKFALLYAF